MFFQTLCPGPGVLGEKDQRSSSRMEAVGGGVRVAPAPTPCTPTPSRATGRAHQGRFRLLSASRRFHFWVWETSGCVRAGQLQDRGFQSWPSGQPGFCFVGTGTRRSRSLVSCPCPCPAPLHPAGAACPGSGVGHLLLLGVTGGEASNSGWRLGPVTFLGLPQAPQDSPHQTSWGSPRPLGRGLPPKSDWFGLSSRQAPPGAPGPTLGSQASAKA